MWPSKYKYDAFISHAVEDKLPIANDLCLRLEKEGLNIWYSGKELMAGDSLEKTILKGLAQSRYGIVILSHKYLEKNWPMREFYILMAKEITHRKVVLPVLFEITVEELANKEMAMIDKWAIPSNKGMDYVVQQLISVINPRNKRRMTLWEWIEENFYALKFWLAVFMIMSLVSFISWDIVNQYPSDAFIEHTIDNRIQVLQQRINRDNDLASSSGLKKVTSVSPVEDIYDQFMNVKSHYRNEYEFDNSIQIIRGKRNVERALNIDIISLTPHTTYNLTDPSIFYAAQSAIGVNSLASYSFCNTLPVQYEIVNERFVEEDVYEVTVSFTENLRVITVNLLFPGGNQPLKKHMVAMKGFLPKEKYIFEKKGGEWVLRTVE